MPPKPAFKLEFISPFSPHRLAMSPPPFAKSSFAYKWVLPVPKMTPLHDVAVGIIILVLLLLLGDMLGGLNNSLELAQWPKIFKKVLFREVALFVSKAKINVF